MSPDQVHNKSLIEIQLPVNIKIRIVNLHSFNYEGKNIKAG
jgi:hypothetical protein